MDRGQNKYKGQQGNHTNNEVRYRDWQNLKYWFRAVEKYAPWVRKIHFCNMWSET